MYVRAYLAIPWVSANDNVKNTKSNIRYDNTINKNETNVKYIDKLEQRWSKKKPCSARFFETALRAVLINQLIH